ncbi:MAG TPA: hypothetical protein VN737_15745 [Bryobacteraceae bacterium]|nr:hypothetical protein [Bryobacteraceae bacterium]
MLPRPGLEVDEVLFISALQHPDRVAYSRFWFHHREPLMLLSYLGALKSWLYAPLFAAGWLNVWSIRLPALILAAVTILLLAWLAWEIAGWTATIIIGWLLATDAVFLLTAVFDWGPVVLQNLLLATALLLFYHWGRTKRKQLLFWGTFAIGLALWDKALFVWNLSGMIVPLLLFGFGAVRRRITIQNASLAILGLLLGTMPLILFNIRHKNETLGANTHLSLIDVPKKFHYLIATLNSDTASGAIADIGVPGAAVPVQSRAQRASLGLAGATKSVAGDYRSWLFVFLFVAGISVAKGAALRWILFFLVSASLAWIQSALTIGAGESIHHSVLIWPLLYLGAAVSANCLLQRLGRARMPVLVSGLTVFSVLGFLLVNRCAADLVRYSANTPWTDADVPLVNYLRSHGVKRVITTDWGIDRVIEARSRAAISVQDESFPIRGGRLEDRLLFQCVVPECIIAGHVTARDVFPNQSQKLARLVRANGFEIAPVAEINDSHGTPTFRLFRLQPAD